MLHSLMHNFIVIWFGWVAKWGYLGVFLLMAMESAVFPVPSEIVVPPAAFLAAEGHLSFWGVVLAGTLGSYFGSALLYWLSRVVGRAFIVRYGMFFFLNEKKLEMAERWMHRYEAGGVFFARLLPVIRHLNAIPAGIVKMNFGVFSSMTIAGSFAWSLVLAYFGREAHAQHPDAIKSPEEMLEIIKAQSHYIVLGILALTIAYFVVLKLTAKPIEARGAEPESSGAA